MLSKHKSSESVLKKWFKNKWHTISAFVGCVIISEFTGNVYPVRFILITLSFSHSSVENVHGVFMFYILDIYWRTDYITALVFV